MGAGVTTLLTAIPDGRVFGLDQQMLISTGIQLFNAALLAVALSYILYKPIRNFLRKRAEGISAQAQRAEDDIAKAGELKEKYQKMLEGIEEERASILASAHQHAVEKNRRLLSEVQEEISAVKKRATEDIEAERERANDDIRLHIIEVASLMAEKYVRHAMDAETQDRLFAEAIVELEENAWQA